MTTSTAIRCPSQLLTFLNLPNRIKTSLRQNVDDYPPILILPRIYLLPYFSDCLLIDNDTVVTELILWVPSRSPLAYPCFHISIGFLEGMEEEFEVFAHVVVFTEADPVLGFEVPLIEVLDCGVENGDGAA